MTVVMVIHFFICAFLVFVILLQPGKSDGGIGFGSSSQSIFGSRGAGNFLTKLTSGCAIVFLITSFILTRSRIQEYTSSVIGDSADTTGAASEKPAPTATPGAPVKAAEPAIPGETGEPKK